MRRAARVDGNHGEIVQALREAGVSVQSLAAVGNGVPDLLAGRSGKTYLLEVKDPTKPRSKRLLTKDQQRWRLEWNGHVATVETPQEALRAVGLLQ